MKAFWYRAGVGVGLAMVVAACSKSKPADETHDSGAVAVTSAHSAPSASALAVVPLGATAVGATGETGQSDAPLPTERKADRKAFREITATNYTSELDKVEKELQSP